MIIKVSKMKQIGV